MYMSNADIVKEYKEAKDRSLQVRILADQNCCSVEQIIGILVASGIDHRCFSGLHRKLNKEAEQKEDKSEEEAGKKPYKKPEIIPGPPKKADIPAPVIVAVEDKITELKYMIEKNAEQAKSLQEHNEKFSARIGVLTAWLEEVRKNESTET